MLKFKHLSYYLVFTANIATFLLGLWDFDFGDYTTQLNNLLGGNFLLENGDAIHRYPPITSLIYTFFIKISFSKQIGIFILHNLFCFFILFFSDKIQSKFAPGIPTKFHVLKALVILNPFMYSFVIRGVNSEIIFVLLNFISFHLLIKNNNSLETPAKSSFFILGMIVGLSMLTRTQGLALLISTLLFFLLQKRLKEVLVLIFGCMITLLPWQTYVNTHNRSGSSTFISSGGLRSFRDGFTYNNKKFRNKLSLPKDIENFSNDFYDKFYVRNIQNDSISEKEYVIHTFKENPKLFFEFFFFKLGRCFYGTDSQNPKVEMINILLVSLFMAFNIFVLFQLKNADPGFKAIYLITLFYLLLTILMTTVVLALLRYQAPVFIFMLLLNLIFAFNYKKWKSTRGIQVE